MTAPEVLGVTVPPGAFRTPRAVVAVRCGAVVLRVTVRRLSGARMDVAPPLAADGAAGVEMPPALWEAVQGAALAAVQADEFATLAMLAAGRTRHAAFRQRGENDGEP